ncbi:MAG: prefoldin subunit alpha [Candidatus Diapherotrites archaeon]|nr:prefoldin subunit alpha [Candidatus Diapherotrites archaeon]
MVEITAEQAIGMIRGNEAKMGQISEQLQGLARSLEVLMATRSTLEEIKGGEKEGLVPVGGVYLPVGIDVSTVKVEVGSGVVLEKSREEAIEIVKRRENTLRETADKLQGMAKMLRTESMEIRKKLAAARQPPTSDVPVISG